MTPSTSFTALWSAGFAPFIVPLAITLVALVLAVSILRALSRTSALARPNARPALNIIECPSPNFGERNVVTPDFLILHYTAMNSAEAALKVLSDPKRPEGRVSSHYLVDEQGKIYRLVGEDKAAWHAGVSFWDGFTGLNSRSIGIEIANPGDRQFKMAQMKAVEALCLDIISRHNIPALHVLGHSDIAPTRKQDPGPFFDWRSLAAAGVGLLPAVVREDYITSAQWTQPKVHEALIAFGYNPADDLKAVVTAFQSHYQPEKFKSPARVGIPDAETVARLAALLRVKNG